MPVVMEQVNRMSAVEKLPLVEYILNSLAVVVERAKSDAALASKAHERKKPRISDFIGYGRRFHPEYRSTEEVMRELREGEKE